MDDKRQTIVEWQFEELFNSFEKYHSGKYTFGEYLSHNLKVINTAKEREKLQRISDFRAGIDWSGILFSKAVNSPKQKDKQ